MTTISFGGQNISRPGSFSVVDSAAMTPVSVGSFRTLGFLGEAPLAPAGTAKNTVLWFNATKAKAAKAALGAGNLYDALTAAWSHGADLVAVAIVKGATATATDTEWQAVIDQFDNVHVHGIVPVTTSAALQTKIDVHCQAQSDIKLRKERRAFYGHAAGLTASAVVNLQTALNTSRGLMASPAVKTYDATGKNLVVRDSVLLAAAYAGLWASKNPQDPITYDYVKFPGLEKNYNPVEIEDLLAGHIAPTEFVPDKGLRIVQGITLSSSEDLTECELSVATLKDVMSKELRDTLEDRHVGNAGVANIEVTVYNDAISILESFIANGWISGYDPEKVVVTKDATTFELEWEGQPTLPINNFLITSHFTL